jgi:predicted Zn-dependent peptidase
VSVDVWYRVGSVDEGQGQHGFAHACEHLLDLGASGSRPSRSAFLTSIGATPGNRVTASATTGLDYTQFFATILSSRLDSMLSFEARRMATPFAFDSAAFVRTRTVIRQERNVRVESQVFGSGIDSIRTAMYPAGHPYAASPLAPMNELDAASAPTVLAFCEQYYAPNNAVIAISGDFDARVTGETIRRDFAKIARRSIPPRRAAPIAALSTQKRLVLQDSRARISRLRFAWPGVGFSHPDKVALYALAGVLSGDKYGFGGFGRLSQLLVRDRQLATSVHAELYDVGAVGEFIVEVVAKSGASLTEIEHVVDSVVADIAAHGVGEQDVSGFKNLNAVEALTSLQSHAARSDTLAQGELWARDPGMYAKQLAQASRIDGRAIQAVARKYLARPHIVMSLVPANAPDRMNHGD